MDSQALKSKQSMQSSLISLILTVDKKKRHATENPIKSVTMSHVRTFNTQC